MWSFILYGLGIAFMAVMIAGMAIVTREIFNLKHIEGFANYEGFDNTTVTYAYQETKTLTGTCTCTGPVPPGLSNGPTTSFPYDSSSYLLKLNKNEINVVRIAVVMFWIFIIAAVIGGVVLMMG